MSRRPSKCLGRPRDALLLLCDLPVIPRKLTVGRRCAVKTRSPLAKCVLFEATSQTCAFAWVRRGRGSPSSRDSSSSTRPMSRRIAKELMMRDRFELWKNVVVEEILRLSVLFVACRSAAIVHLCIRVHGNLHHQGCRESDCRPRSLCRTHSRQIN
jgi:hypothetical protein